jgi:hypothetical protein
MYLESNYNSNEQKPISNSGYQSGGLTLEQITPVSIQEAVHIDTPILETSV